MRQERRGSRVGAASLVCGWGGWAPLRAGGLCRLWEQRLGFKARSCQRRGREEGQNWTEWSCHPNNQSSPFLPKLGDGGASSFGLRLRTGDRCSLKGRSKRHRKACGRLSACSLSPILCPQGVPAHTRCFRASPCPVSSYSSGGCSFGVGTWANWKGCQTLAPWFLTLAPPVAPSPDP